MTKGRKIFDMGRGSNLAPLIVFDQAPGISNIWQESEAFIAAWANAVARNDAAQAAFNEERRRQREQVVQADLRRRHENEMRRREEAKREVEKMAAKDTKAVMQLETGESRDGVNASSRLFFVYVTPTGAEMPISKCPHIVKTMGRTTGGFGDSSRLTVTEYEIKSNTVLKMVNLKNAFGSPKKVVNLFLNIDPEAPAIELKGLGGFGKFRGRARVDYKISTYFSNREGFKLTEAVLHDHFGLRTLQPSCKGAGKSVRSLIFE